MRESRTAAILLIGNELLSGRVEDRNLSFLARSLWEQGIRVVRAEIVRDERAEIAPRVRDLCAGHAFVFTTGGIGPTHDDVTIAAVADAFSVPVIEEPELARRIREHFQERTTSAHLRMALVPQGATLVGGGLAWPTIRIDNCFVLPGVPSILERKFEDLRPLLGGAPFVRASLALVVEEADLAPTLDALALSFPRLEIGSYPERRRVLVTIEGRDAVEVDEALARLASETAHLPRA
ncbi:MAG: competence/damage-inducible protein A [Acidobacteria bacterium]|nr:competence/damage-inducible protein A [Acidobacteriota bacterium]